MSQSTVGVAVSGRYERTPIKYINPSSWGTTKMSPRQYKALKESLRRFGQLQPVVVRVNPSRAAGDVSVDVVDGDKRLGALLELGALEVDCINIGVRDDVHCLEVHLALNLDRGKPKADALADAIENVVEAPKTESAKAMSEISLSRLIPLAKMPVKMVAHLRSRGRSNAPTGNPKATKGWIDFAFKIAPSAARVCDDALSFVEKHHNVKRPQAFELICADFLAGAPKGGQP